MKWLLRICAFSFAIVLGVATAYLNETLTQPVLVPDLTETVRISTRETLPSTSPIGIQVVVIGSFQDLSENGSRYLKFLIYNGLDEHVTYAAYEAESPLPYEKVKNRKFGASWYCGVGLKNFAIAPHESAIVKVYRAELNHLPRKNGHYSIGFRLNKPNGESDVYYSNPIFVLDQFREL